MLKSAGIFFLITVFSIIIFFLFRFGFISSIVNNFNQTSPVPSPVETTSIQARIGEPVPFALKLPEDFAIGVFAKDLTAPRDLQLSPGGTMLTSIPKLNKIVALPDKNLDGTADSVIDVLTKLNNPHGLAFYNNQLFVAEETRVSRFIWNDANLTAQFDKELFTIPAGGRHTSRSLTFDKNGNLYVSIGSTCDVCFEKHNFYAAVVVSNSEGANPQVFSKGLRNSVFITVHPETGDLWGTDMGRDFLGDFNPPDEVNIIKNNRDYGWPICWGERVHDTLFDKNIYVTDPCRTTESPLYGIAAHSAPLGLTFINSSQFPKEWQNNPLVAYHGSWNRTSPIGYKVVRLDLEGNNVVAETDFVSEFLNRNNQVLGRPVDMEFDLQGSLFISDDKTGMVYKVIYQEKESTP